MPTEAAPDAGKPTAQEQPVDTKAPDIEPTAETPVQVNQKSMPNLEAQRNSQLRGYKPNPEEREKHDVAQRAFRRQLQTCTDKQASAEWADAIKKNIVN